MLLTEQRIGTARVSERTVLSAPRAQASGALLGVLSALRLAPTGRLMGDLSVPKLTTAVRSLARAVRV